MPPNQVSLGDTYSGTLLPIIMNIVARGLTVAHCFVVITTTPSARRLMDGIRAFQF
jgi:hypothetical protein